MHARHAISLALTVAALLAAGAPARAAMPIPGGHYAMQTPDVCDTPVTASDGCIFGGPFPFLIGRASPDRFTPPSWLTLYADCSRWESQAWDFRFYTTRTQPAVRVREDGTFTVTRRGVFFGRDYRVGHPLAPAVGAHATLRLKGRFTRPGVAVGIYRVAVTNGCKSGPQPFRLAHRPTGWSDLLNRT
jgi:hypothetical protein